MDFDSKLSLFKKKALWKQLEGYKTIISQKEEIINKCEKEKAEADRVAKVLILALNKINNAISYNITADLNLHESFLPISEFVHSSNLGEDFNRKSVEMNIRTSAPVSELQKDLKISEMETKLNGEIDRCKLLENKIFSMEKHICILKNSQNNEVNGSLSKRPRVETDKNEPSIEASNVDQDLVAKYNVAMAELEALKLISKTHLSELNSLQVENQKLLQDVDSKRDQLRRIPSELLKDGASFRQMNDDLKRYKSDLNDASSTIKNLQINIEDSIYRNKKIISHLEHDVKEKYTKLDEFVKTTDSEIARLRKDRDSMREMYEQTNALLSSCQKQLSLYQKNINCSETAIRQLTESIGKLKLHISMIPALNNERSDFNKAIEILRSDEQMYVEELENLGKAFEQLQEENANLVKKLGEKDDQISKLMGDKLKAEFSLSQAQKEADSSLERAQKIEEIAKHRINEIETREDSLRRQVVSMDKSLSDQILSLNNYKARISEATAENSYLRGKIDKQIAEISELKNSIPSPGQKDQLAFEKRMLTEELLVANKKLDAYAASGVGIVKDLEEELVIYKKMMKCNSCHTRDKNAVILKCMHCFCKNCLDIRLETRQRKCPNCGDPFGASDVKQIFL